MKYHIQSKFLILLFIGGMVHFMPYTFFAQSVQDLAMEFDGKYGQVEIGGKYAGLEFHHSRSMPSRISFYYPVANSIDLSTDYWKRGESQPFRVNVISGGDTCRLENESCVYEYTPFSAVFRTERKDYRAEVTYHFGGSIPGFIWQLKLKNISNRKMVYKIETGLNLTLRTCQSYEMKTPSAVEYQNEGTVCLARYDAPETANAAVFAANAGKLPEKNIDSSLSENQMKSAAFSYNLSLRPTEEAAITQVIASCTKEEADDLIQKARNHWESDCREYEEAVLKYALGDTSIIVHDEALDQTTRWAKAVLASNRHYIDGHIMPMPCPAEYNFYFTHDVLHTDLGAVMFDASRVKNDLLFLKSLTGADSVLPHAYYWRDDGFKTEFCQSDNWNHFWFIIVSNAYLQHSGDEQTVRQIYPILQKSLQMVLKNKGDDDLMYATRPDWWDIGNLYGARSYVTMLMIRSFQDFAAISRRLFLLPPSEIVDLIHLSGKMKTRLQSKLWNSQEGFLFNMLDSSRIDKHYYAGSVLGAAFDILDDEKKGKLLETARTELLASQIGIRNAMPADFNKLIDLYHFNDMEMGEPYIYANGGSWPHGTAWYILGLISNGQADEARRALIDYLTLQGIRNSPNGQPSFYEYRNTDPNSPDYGKIDKPTFLWAGGWYLNALYHLAGVRQNSRSLWIDANLPEDFRDVSFNLMNNGQNCRIDIRGSGSFFKNISRDGESSHSAVLFGQPTRIRFEKGVPEHPYLASADFTIQKVKYDTTRQVLSVTFAALPGLLNSCSIVAPIKITYTLMNDNSFSGQVDSRVKEGIYIYRFNFVTAQESNTLMFQF